MLPQDPAVRPPETYPEDMLVEIQTAYPLDSEFNTAVFLIAKD